ncbi:MAG: pyruvate formate lyase family protein [Terrimicrobiaceae bacterium]
MNTIREEMTKYYTPLRNDRLQENAVFLNRRSEIWAEMDAYEKANPSMPACLLKAKLQEVIAERFEPILFPHNPFFFEMGMRCAENWGTPGGRETACVAAWTWHKRMPAKKALPSWQSIESFRSGGNPWNIWTIWNPVDNDHHSLGYTKLLRVGVNGILAEIAHHRAAAQSPQSAAFLEAAERSCRAVLRVAERFAQAAEARLPEEKDPQVRRNFQFIAEAARRVPALPPRTFKEGLAALLFLREATASLEAIGISLLGHPDRLLGGLYRHDVAEGVITEAEARDLIGRWMLPTDIKFHIDDGQWPETSTCIELGGCDEEGRPVYNDVTRLFIETHHSLNLINPKLQCRYGSTSPDTYINLLALHAGEGHNNFAFLNDDVLIPALIRAGKTERHARLYVNGGCQETITEGVEHSAGAYYYFNMARLLDLFLNPREGNHDSSALQKVLPQASPDDPASFEEFYEQFMSAFGYAVGRGAGWLKEAGQGWEEVHPCPFFSSTLEGCLEKGRDYTAGGAIYNPANLALVGFATVVDSLQAIRQIVFEERVLSLKGLAEILASNWAGNEALHARMVAATKFGHGDAECDALAARFARDLVVQTSMLQNERGGRFVSSLFVYYAFVWMGKHTRATPDGRRAGDVLSQGVSPSRGRLPNNLTDVVRAMEGIDMSDFPGNAVLDIQLPLTPSSSDLFSPLAATLRTFAALGGATLQTNVVSTAMLRDAKRHPDRYSNLTVRICGLSARFTTLDEKVQDEIISRSSD